MKITILEGRSMEVEDLTDVITFLFGDCFNEDVTTLRAMIVWGATRDQIVRALVIAATKRRVSRDDKLTYAFGVVKNLMLESQP